MILGLDEFVREWAVGVLRAEDHALVADYLSALPNLEAGVSPGIAREVHGVASQFVAVAGASEERPLGVLVVTACALALVAVADGDYDSARHAMDLAHHAEAAHRRSAKARAH